MIWIFILISTVLISILAFRNRDLYLKSMFIPYEIFRQKQWYRIFTYGFIHSNWGHLIVNMLTFYFFAPYLEKTFEAIFTTTLGRIYFTLLYFLALPISSFADLLKYKNNPVYAAVGASGAVSAVVFAVILLYPNATLGVFFVIPMKAFVFGFLYLLYSYWMAKKQMDNIGHSAHFWGAVFGFVFPILLKPALFLNFWFQIFS